MMNTSGTSALVDLERQSSLYEVVRESIRRSITTGEVETGSRLPSEALLCERFSVSRATLRRAVDDLVAEGVLFRRQGSGTYVAATRINLDLMQLRGMKEELRAQGHEPEVTMLVRRIVPASDEVATALRMAPGDPVIHMKRLLKASGTPLALAEGYFPYARCAPLMDTAPDGSMYQAMEEQLGMRLGYATQRIEARIATTEQARLLGVPRRAAVMLLTRVTYLVTGDPVHFGHLNVRPDRYRAEMVLRRSGRGVR